MGWNNAYETKKFEAKQKKQAEEYRALGMTEEQIKEMYEFDLEQLKSERRYRMHTQPLQVEEFEEKLLTTCLPFESSEFLIVILSPFVSTTVPTYSRFIISLPKSQFLALTSFRVMLSPSK